MKALAVNPYLPYWENVADGEPRVFGKRIYIFGSHDKQNGKAFCTEDYVCWSAPVDDLSDWKCEGVIYQKSQDPINGAPYDKELPFSGQIGTEGNYHTLYAPDVTQGPDGRYYLYYALDFANVISVAVCDEPAGKYEFLGYVTRKDGSLPHDGLWFDPAILSEETGNYLYYGFCPFFPMPGTEGMKLEGAMMVKLADDMHTIISEPICVAKGDQEHAFFEASSIRKFGDYYYFVYSSKSMHNLCYAMAKTPEGPFEYKGVLISNADIEYQNNTLATNYFGNNHGGLAKINGEYYVFWHRHTHGTTYSRQGCADRVTMLEDGSILQTEITSCGLNGSALPARGKYSAYIACHLTGPNRDEVGIVLGLGSAPGQLDFPYDMPYITEEYISQKDCKPYIYNLQPGALAGFKYFHFEEDSCQIILELRGQGKAAIVLDSPDGPAIAEVESTDSNWNCLSAQLENISGIHSLYVKCTDGRLDFAGLEFVPQ